MESQYCIFELPRVRRFHVRLTKLRQGWAMWFRQAFHHRFVRFLGVGLINTLVGYVLFWLALVAGMEALAAAAAATAMGALFNFFSIGIVVFRQAGAGLLPRFLLVYVGQYGVNAAGLTILIGAGLGSLMAQFLLLPLLAAATYVAMRHWVFVHQPGSDPISYSN